jgi:two-component sensor histidine kinase
MTSWGSWTGWLPASLKEKRTKISQKLPFGGGLRFRFWLIVHLALLPVAVLSVWQGFDRLRLDQENVRDNLRQSAYAAASDEFNVFFAAEQLLRTMASDPTIRNGSTGCRTRLIQALEGQQFFANFARVSSAGALLCVAKASPRSFDAKKSLWWQQILSDRVFTIAGPLFSASVGREILLGALPLKNADGSFDGTLNVAIDIGWLDHAQLTKRLARGGVVALFDAGGRVIASNNGPVANLVFARGVSARPGDDGLLSSTGPRGEAWSLAMAPVIRRDYFVGFAMPSAQLFRFTYVHVAVDLLLPVLMVLLASLGIWGATDRLATRWITLLQRTAAAYRGGHYTIRPAALKDAPDEFRALGGAMSDMALAVKERDQGLRDALEQKAVLIKEIHHRVKNNLQIVMSLLSLQSSRLKDRSARDAVDQARLRVNALALVHRMIYELDRDGIVDVKPLLEEVVEQQHQGLGGDRHKIKLRVDVPSFRTDGDTAIPLTLFAIEALTNAFKHGFPQSTDSGTITVSLERPAAGRLKLVVEDDGRGIGVDDGKESGTGARLMTALANQVGGEVSTGLRDGGGTRVEMTFPEARKMVENAGTKPFASHDRALDAASSM